MQELASGPYWNQFEDDPPWTLIWTELTALVVASSVCCKSLQPPPTEGLDVPDLIAKSSCFCPRWTHERQCLLLRCFFFSWSWVGRNSPVINLSWFRAKTLTVESWTARERSGGASEAAPLDPTQGLLHCVGPVALLQSNMRSLGKRDDDYENERGLSERLNRTVMTLHNHNSHSSSPILTEPCFESQPSTQVFNLKTLRWPALGLN